MDMAPASLNSESRPVFGSYCIMAMAMFQSVSAVSLVIAFVADCIYCRCQGPTQFLQPGRTLVLSHLASVLRAYSVRMAKKIYMPKCLKAASGSYCAGYR